MERYKIIRASDLEACRQALAVPLEVDQSIDVYFQRVEDAIQFSHEGKTPFKLAQFVQTSYHTIKKGLYSLALKEWRKNSMEEEMYDSFKTVFAEEYHDLVEDAKVTTGDLGFHLANAMQDNGGGLSNTYPLQQGPTRILSPS